MRQKRPEEPGGCVKNPIALRVSKPEHLSPYHADPQRINCLPCLRNSHELWIDEGLSHKRHMSASPKRLGCLATRHFMCHADVIQQVVVERGQRLSLTTACHPNSQCANTFEKNAGPFCWIGRRTTSGSARFVNGRFRHLVLRSSSAARPPQPRSKIDRTK